MPGALTSRLSELPSRCRDRLLDAWYLGDRRVLALLVIPLAMAGVLGSLVYFAYTDHQRLRAEQHRRAELRCLAQNVYYEGRGEPADGQQAIAEVTLNRVASPRFPDTVCGVVHQRRFDALRGRYVGAFSWTELELRPPSGPAWRRAMAVAEGVYDADRPPLVPQALYYHSVRARPRWARSKTPLARIGAHVFYR